MNDEVSSLNAGINLVPQTTKKPQQVRRALLVAVLFFRYTLLIVALFGAGIIIYRSYLSLNLSNTTDEIAEQLTYIEEQQEFQEDFLSLQVYADELGARHSSLKEQASIFSILGEITPQVIILDELTVSQENVRLSGTTPEYPAITDYFTQLSNSGEFENVQIVSISRPTESGEDTRIVFTISVDIK